PHLPEQVRGFLAVAVGFEPTDGGYPSRAFEARSFGRSVTPPLTTLADCTPHPEIAWSQLLPRPPLSPEELFEHRRALGFEDTGTYLGAVRQSPVANDVPQRPHSTGLRLPRPEDDPRDPRQHRCAGTHRAGFQG